MSKFNKSEFLEKLTHIKYATEPQESWDEITKAVTESAQVTYQKRIAKGESGSALHDWWNSCVELLLNYQVVINDVNFDASKNKGEPDEYIELLNNSSLPIDLTGWKINAGNKGQDMIFPASSLISPGSLLRIYTNKIGKLSFNSNQSVWNNKGDKAFLYDATGEVISRWSYGIKAHADVAITHIFFDGTEKYTEADEYVEIANFGDELIDLSNWQLSAGKQQKFNFPEKSVLFPHCKIRVYTNKIDKHNGGYSFDSHSAVWNNQGDTGVLTDHKGVLVSEYRY